MSDVKREKEKEKKRKEGREGGRRRRKEGKERRKREEGRKESIVIPVSSSIPSVPDPPANRSLSSGDTPLANVMSKGSTHL